MQPDKIGRPVRVVSLSFNNRGLEEICEIVDLEGSKGSDLIILPEMWRGTELETLDGETVSRMAQLAKKNSTYIVCPIYRQSGGKRYNTAVLLNRQGECVHTYDKVFPYWEEFDLKPAVEIGTEITAYDTDFGRIGLAICFDANFPEVWKCLADQGAELVIWVSAYSAGTCLQAHAINNNYYIVSSTLVGDCIICDITGQEIMYEKNNQINISKVTLDLDRGIYHENFNIEKRDKLLKEYPGVIKQELHMEREQWFVLSAQKAGISARELAKSFGMEELREYKNRSRLEIDRLRGWKFADKAFK